MAFSLWSQVSQLLPERHWQQYFLMILSTKVDLPKFSIVRWITTSYGHPKKDDNQHCLCGFPAHLVQQSTKKHSLFCHWSIQKSLGMYLQVLILLPLSLVAIFQFQQWERVLLEHWDEIFCNRGLTNFLEIFVRGVYCRILVLFSK